MNFIRLFIESYLPPNYSSHGHHVDNLIVWTHYLMFLLFIGWGVYFIYTLFKFRASNNSKANYDGVKSHYSSYVEVGIILFEAFLIFALAIPKWQDLKLNIEKPKDVPIAASIIDLRDSFLNINGVNQDDINTFFPANEVNKDKQVIHVIAQTFNYNIHYPGPDGKFGTRKYDLAKEDDPTNPIGLDPEDENGYDDIVLVDELILEVDKPVLIYLTSKDVIHSFFLPEFRVKQDAIPGQRVAIFFTPKITSKDFLEGLNPEAEEFSLWDWIADPEGYVYDEDQDDYIYPQLDYNGDGNSAAKDKSLLTEIYGRDTFQLGCAQLCGSGHSTMNKGDMFIVTPEEYQQWYFGQMWAKHNTEEEEVW